MPEFEFRSMDKSRLSVVLVDDDRVVRAWASSRLDSVFDLVTCETGAAAIEAIKRRRVDAVIVDLNLPDMHGMDLIGELRRRPATSHVAIVVLAGGGNAAQVLDGGADDFVRKPVDPEELTARVKRAWRRSREAVEYRQFLDSLPVGLWTTDTAGACTYLNREMRRILGTDGDVSRLEAAFERYALHRRESLSYRNGENETVCEFAYATGDEVLWLIDTCRIEHDPAGGVVGRQGVVQDITAEADAQRRMRAFFDEAWSAMFIEDFSAVGSWFDELRAEGVEDLDRYIDEHPDSFDGLVRSLMVVGANTAAVDLFEAGSTDDLVAAHDPDLLGPEGMSAIKRQVVAFWRGSSRVELEVELQTWKGRRFPALLQITVPQIDDMWDFAHTLVWISDLTRRNEMVAALQAQNEQLQAMQEEALRAEKLESIGSLAAGIAHEINTPIQYIGDNLRFMETAFSEFAEIHEAAEKLAAAAGERPEAGAYQDAISRSGIDFWLEEMPLAMQQSLEGVEHVATIVRALKEFSHPDSGTPESVDINEIIASAVELSRNEWKYVADLETELDPDVESVVGLPGRLRQVMLNLIVNAAQAIKEHASGDTKGVIRLATRHRPGWVEIAVEDTGGGIPNEVRDRIFDPFFTTKPVGQGTGQGLAIAHKVIVEEHGGRIGVDSRPGVGTTFRLELPIRETSAS